MRKLSVVLSILSAGFFITSCDENTGTACQNVCLTEGELICGHDSDGMDVSMLCMPSADSSCLEYVEYEKCANGCSAGYCLEDHRTCVSDCSEGQKACLDQNTLNVCEKGADGCFHYKPMPCNGACVNNACQQGCVSECSAGDLKCSGNAVMECREIESGCSRYVQSHVCDKYCTEGQCTGCPPPCTENAVDCFGKTMKRCQMNAQTQCLEWTTVKACSGYCDASKGGCTEDLPRCKMEPGAKALIRQWTDGDTVWVVSDSDKMCNNYEYDAKDNRWKQIRWRIRVHGIDAPECSKEKNKFYYYVCRPDNQFTNTNERYGYESWVWAEQLLPYKSSVTLSCDHQQASGECEFDNTSDEHADPDQQVYNRYLAYIGYTRGNASYDYSTEIAREGLAFSNTKFSSSKRRQICEASKEAQNAGRNIWSIGDGSASSVLGQMSSTKRKGLKNMKHECNLR